MHDKIQDIQNKFWAAYKSFCESKDMEQYNTDVRKIVDKYKYNSTMLEFCQGLVIAWAPIINGINKWAI